jgi:antitoxin FitA
MARAKMATLLVRDLDEELVAALKRLARAHGRSAEAEHRAILEAALRPHGETFLERARRLQQETAGSPQMNSTDLIRADRDRVPQ